MPFECACLRVNQKLKEHQKSKNKKAKAAIGPYTPLRPGESSDDGSAGPRLLLFLLDVPRMTLAHSLLSLTPTQILLFYCSPAQKLICYTTTSKNNDIMRFILMPYPEHAYVLHHPFTHSHITSLNIDPPVYFVTGIHPSTYGDALTFKITGSFESIYDACQRQRKTGKVQW